MSNSSPAWDAYCALLACRLVDLDKRPGVRPLRMGETLRQALAKLVMRSSGDQTKTACGNLQPCAGLKTGIEAGTHVLKQQILERVRERQREEEAAEGSEEEED